MPLFVRNARQKPQMARLEETGAKLLCRVHFPHSFSQQILLKRSEKAELQI